jgi:prepilin-type N-terminal cleavage/methylation domain-containing protein
MRRTRARRHGFSLVEVMVAMGVLAIGGLATLQLIGVLINSNKNLGAGTDGVALANRVMSEVQAAPFFTDQADPGLVIGAFTQPVIGSRVRTVGWFAPNNPDPLPDPGGGNIPVDATYAVRYQVYACASCDDPTGSGVGGPGGVEVVVEVANAKAGGPLLRPVQFMVRKERSTRTDSTSPVRGL